MTARTILKTDSICEVTKYTRLSLLFIPVEIERAYQKSVHSYETFRTFVGIMLIYHDIVMHSMENKLNSRLSEWKMASCRVLCRREGGRLRTERWVTGLYRVLMKWSVEKKKRFEHSEFFSSAKRNLDPVRTEISSDATFLLLHRMRLSFFYPAHALNHVKNFYFM